MFAPFHSNLTNPSSKDKLNTAASGMLICSTISNSNLGGIPSTQVIYYPSYLFIFIATIVGVTISCPK